MTIANLDLIGDLAVVRGETWDKVDFYYPENITNWTARMQIRNNLYNSNSPDKTPTIATFAVPPLVYGSYTLDGSTINATKISPSLTWSTTRSISIPTAPIKDKLILGTNVWIYELEIFNSVTNIKIKLCRGFVEVIGEVALF